jgi:hypothetical protein
MGCQVRAERYDIASKGAMVLLQLTPSLAVAGQIIWLSGKDFGVRFYRPLSEGDVASVATDDIVVSAKPSS